MPLALASVDADLMVCYEAAWREWIELLDEFWQLERTTQLCIDLYRPEVEKDIWRLREE